MIQPYQEGCIWETKSEESAILPPWLSLGVCETASSCNPRNPAGSILYRVIAGHLESFPERQHKRNRTVPRFFGTRVAGFSRLRHPGQRFPAVTLRCLPPRQDPRPPHKGATSCPGLGIPFLFLLAASRLCVWFIIAQGKVARTRRCTNSRSGGDWS